MRRERRRVCSSLTASFGFIAFVGFASSILILGLRIRNPVNLLGGGIRWTVGDAKASVQPNLKQVAPGFAQIPPKWRSALSLFGSSSTRFNTDFGVSTTFHDGAHVYAKSHDVCDGRQVNIRLLGDKYLLARVAAAQAGTSIRRAIRQDGRARIIAATGASQFEFLDELTADSEIDWKHVELFHLDEYLDIPITHPASFRKYLLDRLINKVGIERYHLISGEGDPQEVIAEVTPQIRTSPIDVAFVGIGENGHLAFNDPPADFETEESYIVVELDEACRRQQLGEGWFGSLNEVPGRAISMTIRQILKSKEIICIVPDARKAQAVKKCLEGGISPLAPASILRTHPNAFVYLDNDSAALLSPQTVAALSA